MQLMYDQQTRVCKFCFKFWRSHTRSYARQYHKMQVSRADKSLYFKNLVDEMLTRWINMVLMNRNYPGYAQFDDSDDDYADWEIVS